MIEFYKYINYNDDILYYVISWNHQIALEFDIKNNPYLHDNAIAQGVAFQELVEDLTFELNAKSIHRVSRLEMLAVFGWSYDTFKAEIASEISIKDEELDLLKRT